MKTEYIFQQIYIRVKNNNDVTIEIEHLNKKQCEELIQYTKNKNRAVVDQINKSINAHAHELTSIHMICVRFKLQLAVQQHQVRDLPSQTNQVTQHDYCLSLFQILIKLESICDALITSGPVSTESHNRLLSKPAAESEVRGDSARRTGVYRSVHEDSSTESTKQFASAVKNRLLSKPAAESEVRGDSARRTGVYRSVHEDSSTESTKQFASAVGFGKKSNVTKDTGFIIKLKELGLVQERFCLLYDLSELYPRNRFPVLHYIITRIPDVTRLLSKPAAESEVRGDSARRTGVYRSVHEDSSTESTKQFASAVGFGKKFTEPTMDLLKILEYLSKEEGLKLVLAMISQLGEKKFENHFGTFASMLQLFENQAAISTHFFAVNNNAASTSTQGGYSNNFFQSPPERAHPKLSGLEIIRIPEGNQSFFAAFNQARASHHSEITIETLRTIIANHMAKNPTIYHQHFRNKQEEFEQKKFAQHLEAFRNDYPARPMHIETLAKVLHVPIITLNKHPTKNTFYVKEQYELEYFSSKHIVFLYQINDHYHALQQTGEQDVYDILHELGIVANATRIPNRL